MNRRRLLKLIGLPAFALLGGAAYVQAKTARNAYYSGPRTDHFDGIRFSNPPGGPAMKPFTEFLKWQVSDGREEWPDAYPSPFSDKPPARVDGFRIVLVGHASLLIQAAGLNILVDPIWSERASPFTFVGPQRVNPPGIAFDGPAADRRGPGHPQPLRPSRSRHRQRACGTRTGRASSRRSATTPIIRDFDDGIAVETYDWGQSVALSDARDGASRAGLSLVRARRSRTGAWRCGAPIVLTTPAGAIYHIGDTGYGDGAHLPRRARALRRPRDRAPADRRLRAALVHAAAAHEPGRSGARLPRLRRAAGPRPPLGHVPAHRRGHRAAACRRWRRPSRRRRSRRSASTRCGPARCGSRSRYIASPSMGEVEESYLRLDEDVDLEAVVGAVREIGHVFFDEDVLHHETLGVEIGRDRLVGGIDGLVRRPGGGTGRPCPRGCGRSRSRA